MSGHTPGPWVAEYGDTPYAEIGESWVVDAESGSVCTVDSATENREANARLIAAAPDHALIAAALCQGIARWEGSEFCIGGLRHSTKLDEFGVPVMTGGMRAAIAKATGDA